jgi:hypothetical protein
VEGEGRPGEFLTRLRDSLPSLASRSLRLSSSSSFDLLNVRSEDSLRFQERSLIHDWLKGSVGENPIRLRHLYARSVESAGGLTVHEASCALRMRAEGF